MYRIVYFFWSALYVFGFTFYVYVGAKAPPESNVYVFTDHFIFTNIHREKVPDLVNKKLRT